MNHSAKVVAFAILACSVAFAAVLKYEPLKAEMNELMSLIMKPVTPSRYIPAEVYQKMGFDPSTRLMSYEWKNCGNKKKENLLINNIIFAPDPLSFPGPLYVSFDLDLNVTVTGNLKGVLLIEKKIGSTWLKIPCIGQIGSCTYDDICVLLQQIYQCPPELVEAGIPCHCPLKKGHYKLPKTTFDIGASFLPAGDYHIRANLSEKAIDGGCYDIYASFS